jgi:hypothetical protein
MLIDNSIVSQRENVESTTIPFCVLNGLVLINKLFICAGHVARMGETRNAYRILVGKPE